MEENYLLSNEKRYELVLKIAQAVYSTERGRKELNIRIPNNEGLFYLLDNDSNQIGGVIYMDFDDDRFIKDYNIIADALMSQYGINVPKIKMEVSVSFYSGNKKIEA